MVGRQQRVIESMLEARTSFATGNTKDETDADRERRERRQMNHSRYSEVGNTSYHHATQKLPNALASPHDSTAFMAESIFGSGELKDVSLRLLQECLKNLVQRRAEFKEMEVAVQDLINTVWPSILPLFTCYFSSPPSSPFSFPSGSLPFPPLHQHSHPYSL